MLVEPAQFETLRRATLQRFVERLMARFAEGAAGEREAIYLRPLRAEARLYRDDGR